MSIRRARTWLAIVVGVIAVSKTLVAASTFGTDDVGRWAFFASIVADVGPVQIYGVDLAAGYNHPPLAGLMLQGVTLASEAGLSFPLAIRIPAIAADVVTPFLLLEMLRARMSLRPAFAASVAVAVSPALFVISGFHGNTDALMLMLALLAAYLLIDRRAPAWAGVAFAAAISVKVGAFVMLPALAVAALTQGSQAVLRFVGSTALSVAAVWGLALIRVPEELWFNVFGYRGGVEPWGPWSLVDRLAGEIGPGPRDAGGLVAVAVAALFPAALVWRRPRRAAEAAALALPLFLLLLPGFGVQYLAWAIAPAYLLATRPATALNAAASVFLVAVYNRWSGGLPWDVATSSRLTAGEVVAELVVWGALAWTVVAGIGAIVRSPSTPALDAPSHTGSIRA